jgi:AraC family transcriptional regulator, transcriptional activator of pobA
LGPRRSSPQRRSSGDIVELKYQPSVRPELGFELMKFSQLLRRPLSHPLDALTRPSFFLVYYGLEGRSRHTIDFERCAIARHDVAVVAPGRVQAFDPSSGHDMWMVLFTPEFLDVPLRGSRVLSPFWTPPVLRVPSSEQQEVLGLVEQLRAEYGRPADAVQVPLLASLLRAFLLRLERLAGAASSKAPAELEAFRAALEQDYAQTRSVEHYARAAGISPRTLNALTQRHFGTTAKQTIDARVILELKRLLAHTDLTVKELSARFGFDEPTNLVKFFRHHTRQTPLRFREEFG